MSEHMMQTSKAKQVVKLANLTKELPQSDKMISVKSLLSETDQKFVDDYAIGRVCTQIGEEMFFLSPIQKVPDTARRVRQEEGQHTGQIIGIPAVAGG